jgi:hypothetical protein
VHGESVIAWSICRMPSYGMMQTNQSCMVTRSGTAAACCYELRMSGISLCLLCFHLPHGPDTPAYTSAVHPQP